MMSGAIVLNGQKTGLAFIENKGQWPNSDRFRAGGGIAGIQFQEDGVMLSVSDAAALKQLDELVHAYEEAIHHGEEAPQDEVSITTHAWKIRFVGMQSGSRIIAEDKQVSRYNYFLGNDPSKWARSAASYARIRYQGIYPGTDAIFYENEQGHLEYDFELAPGADPGLLQLQFEGQSAVHLDSSGHLILQTVFGDEIYPAPQSWQWIDGKQIPVDVQYQLTDQTMRFQVGAYNPQYPLVIDPIALRWAVYLSTASTLSCHNHGIEVDDAGGIYVGGRTGSSNFPTTSGVYQSLFRGGGSDVFVSKLIQPDTVNGPGALVWSTYIGGSATDNLYGIKTDGRGGIYITGVTNSFDYPTTSGAYDVSWGASGNDDAFVSKLDSSGSALIYSTYLGGSGDEAGNFICINSIGEAYIVGQADSGMSLTTGCHQPVYGGGLSDGFLAILDSSGSSLLYASYYGGAERDEIVCIRETTGNKLTFCGTTTSANNIATASAFQGSLVGAGSRDNGFVVQFDLSPSIGLSWGTYINPNTGKDIMLTSMQTDNSGNVFFGGYTNGVSTAAITSGVYQGSNAGNNDLYIGKLNPSGSSLLAGTYVGGTGNEFNLMGLNLDATASVYVLGYTTSNSPSLVATPTAMQSSNYGGKDALFFKLSPDLQTMEYLSYYGGADDEDDPLGFDGVKVVNCRTYTAITSQSIDAPMTQNAYQAIRTSINIDEPVVAVWSNPPDLTRDTFNGYEGLCYGTKPLLDINGDTAFYAIANISRDGVISTPPSVGTVSYQWKKSTDLITWTDIAGATGLSLSTSFMDTLYQTTYYLRAVSNEYCKGISNYVTKKVWQLPEANFLALDSAACAPLVANFQDISTGDTIMAAWHWEFGPGDSSNISNPTRTYSTAGTFSIKLRVQDAHGCIDTVVKTVTATTPTYINVGVGDTICNGDSASLICSAIDFYQWHPGRFVSDSTIANPMAFPNEPTMFWVEGTDAYGCKDYDSVFVYAVANRANFTVDTICFSDSSNFVDLSNSNVSLLQNWNWDFGDTASGSLNYSSLSNPMHVFSSSGMYTVRLTISDSFGCAVDTAISVAVHAHPIPGFTADTVCPGSVSSFIDLSSDSIISQYWDFGDGNTGSGPAPINIYSAPGDYLVYLEVSDPFCRADTSIYVHVRSRPQAQFNNGSICFDTAYSFHNISLAAEAPLMSQYWNFGDGDTASITDPFHYYDSPGTYAVELIVVDSLGCRDTSLADVHSVRNRANFDVTAACIRNAIFTDLSVSIGGQLNQWLWDFGDPSSGILNQSSLANPTHPYQSPGLYHISLVVWDTAGCSHDTSFDQYIYPLPTAIFKADTACLSVGTQFQDYSFDSISIWNWDFGDGQVSSLQNPLHSYSSPGTYLVQLRVSDTHCPHDTSGSILVRAEPEAHFSGGDLCLGNAFSFSDLSLDGDTTISSWNWNFGDGGTSSLNNPNHIFPSSTVFNVSLEVGDYYGCKDTAYQNINVIQNRAVFSAPAVCHGDSSRFTDLSSSNGSLLIQWNWNFGDPLSGAANSSNLQHPIHVFTQAGLHPVQLTVTDSFGCTHDTTINVRVFQLPLVNFSTDSVCSGDTTHFINLSSDSGWSWSWDFGDGYHDVVENPNHYYNGDGTYTVHLVVRDPQCVSDSSINVRVRAHPEAAFQDGSICADELHHFSDLSILADGPVAFWDWDFGDGNHSSLQHPDYSYSTASLYTVSLAIEDLYGCRDTTSGLITTVKNKANFSLTPLCSQDTAYFGDLSVSQNSVINQWNWNFGDIGSGSANISNLANPSHVFAVGGSYSILLEVIDTIGCRHDTSIMLTVYQKPTANFSTDSVCYGVSTDFTDLSFDSIVSWNWDFGDGFSSGLPNPLHLYGAAGIYPVRLDVSSNHCVADTVINLWVHQGPVADFSVDQGCGGIPLFYYDSSKQGDGLLSDWYWNTGDGNSIYGHYPSHTYSAAGNYLVQLTVSDEYGCQSSDSLLIRVDTIPVLISWPDTVLCPGESVWLYAAGAGNLHWEPGGIVADSILVSPDASTTYTAGGYNGVCPARTADVTVAVYIPAPIEISAIPSTIINGSSSELSLELLMGSDSIVWSPDSFLSCNYNCLHPIANPSSNTTYTATVYYHHQGRTCPIADSITIYINDLCGPELVFIPNTFSPNADGQNDRFFIRSVSVEIIEFFRIYDRWGQLVYEEADLRPNDADRGWDGTNFRKIALNSGVYVYQAELRCLNGDLIEMKGNITLIR